MTVFAVISEQGKAKGNLEYSSMIVRKYLLPEALGNGPLKSKFSRSKTCVALISRASFERTKWSFIYEGLYLTKTRSKSMQSTTKSNIWPNVSLYTCGKRSDDFSLMTLGVELMINDSVNRRFLK